MRKIAVDWKFESKIGFLLCCKDFLNWFLPKFYKTPHVLSMPLPDYSIWCHLLYLRTCRLDTVYCCYAQKRKFCSWGLDALWCNPSSSSMLDYDDMGTVWILHLARNNMPGLKCNWGMDLDLGIPLLLFGCIVIDTDLQAILVLLSLILIIFASFTLLLSFLYCWNPFDFFSWRNLLLLWGIDDFEP